ncbi:MAG: hypothetical protein VKN60_03550 [Cyanobacteriota bacterium]|nr:hypothetical protein [Cyanobacteriota bacterium]
MPPRPRFQRRLRPPGVPEPKPWGERLTQFWGWFLLLVTVGLLLSLIPEPLTELGLNPWASPTPETGRLSQSLWRSGFETGFPGEWLTRRQTKQPQATFQAGGKLSNSGPARWTILNPAQVGLTGITAPEGKHIYAGQLTQAQETPPPAPYPVLEMEVANPAYLAAEPKPLVNQFYVWLDWPKPGAGEGVALMTLAAAEDWQGVSLRVSGAKGELELVGAGPLGGFKTGDGWEIIAPLEPVYLPRRRWVKMTVYLDYAEPLLVVWMNETPIFQANGGSLLQARQSPYLVRAHWGLAPAPTASQARLYNDAIALWTLEAPLENWETPPALGDEEEILKPV